MIHLQSKLTQHLLLFFFSNPIEERYLHELAKILKADAQNLHKTLKKLEEAGLFKSKLRGAERYYSLNYDWPLYKEYRGIIKKTIGAAHIIGEALETIRYLEAVYVDINNPFDVQKEIHVLILRSPNAYNHPSEKAISTAIKRVEKDLERKITLTYTETPPLKEKYLQIL